MKKIITTENKKELADWKRKFTSVALSKGKNFFERAMVKQLKTEGDVTKAFITEGLGFDTQIRYQDGVIARMSCNCPSAIFGIYCCIF